MPAVKKGVMGENEALVKIEEMPDWAQVAFEGYKCEPVSFHLELHACMSTAACTWYACVAATRSRLLL